MKCIYCGKNISKADYNKEHVMPRMLGRFINSPTIRGLVCSECNSMFSSLETKFKEDTQEGIYAQMLNLESSNSVRIRGENVKMDCSLGLGDGFFNEIFPFLKVEDGKFVIEIRPQIKIKNYAKGYQVFLPEALKEIKNKPPKFKKFKQRIKTVGKDNIRIFAGASGDQDNSQLKEMVSLLADFGIKYTEKDGRFISSEELKDKKFELEMDCRVDQDIARVITKIAFNYFAYCAIQDGFQDVLYHPTFNKIKLFIKGDKGVSLNDVMSPDKDCILLEEKLLKKRVVGHTIVFEHENGNITARITFFGKIVYKINLGQILPELLKQDFGCGHFFNPFSKLIINLTQNQSKIGSGDSILIFGLFRKK